MSKIIRSNRIANVRRYAIAFALCVAACGTTPTAQRPQVRDEFLTCYRVGSHIRRLPEECTGPKEVQVKEH